jgi:2,4-dichlorophenol 6-monooxygenase
MNTSSEFDTDVVVVGSGPMGGTTALALATYGVRVHVVSKWNWVANTPRAHIINQRAVEVLRDLGVEEDIKLEATPWEQMGDTLFTTSLGGPEVARLQTWGTGDDRLGDYLKGSPCTMLDVPQPLMEPVLITNAAERGAKVSFNTEYLSHTQDADGVTVTLQNRISDTVFTQRARFLVGADGARSQIAEDIGLEISGELARAGTVYARFDADLSKYVAHRPSILHWIMNPAAGFGEIGMGLLRAVRPWDQWIAGWGFDLKNGEPDLDHGRALEKIQALVGDPNLNVDIVSVAPWYVNQAYAPTYSVGRVLCGGDAVHRHPPSSGLGSNTCVQDGFNLAWKLAFVINGHAGQDLLDSYSLERAPVGQQIVQRANQSRVDYAPLRAAFATTDTDDPVAAGLAKINAPTAEGAKIRDAIQDALQLKSFEFNAHGVELNQRYDSAAVIPDPAAGEEQWARDEQLYLQATTRPGAKLPHAWLVGRDGRRVSTLDVTGKGKFTLLTGLSGQVWVQAAKDLDLPFLRTVVIGEPGSADPYCYWRRISEIDEAGVLLVRPDGYVAWRVSTAVWDTDQATALLRDALDQVLATRTQQEPAPSPVQEPALV